MRIGWYRCPNDESSGYYASVPDLSGCITTGKDMADAINQITDAIFSLITADTIEYRARTDTPSFSRPQ